MLNELILNISGHVSTPVWSLITTIRSRFWLGVQKSSNITSSRISAPSPCMFACFWILCLLLSVCDFVNRHIWLLHTSCITIISFCLSYKVTLVITQFNIVVTFPCWLNFHNSSGSPCSNTFIAFWLDCRSNSPFYC